MKKILYRSLLGECIKFFLIALISTSIIIWVFQAVNYLDLIVEDGRDFIIYLKYALLNYPKIISKLLPFVLFFSFFYIITKYETNNELIIFWNIGVNKINFINYYLKFSFIFLVFQLLLTAIIVPTFQEQSRKLIRGSEITLGD
jgi:lipopolysaccharide export system permease protein